MSCIPWSKNGKDGDDDRYDSAEHVDDSDEHVGDNVDHADDSMK